MNEATKAQNLAARPNVSTWLTANAGSGKTRVLTNRVARLLLNGASPEGILCLTYTTAAASEMQNRLFKTLGAWAMLPDLELKTALENLGEKTPEDLSKARTLFARAIEAPGGLKIQTIHSFCSRVLRQFPLEAGVNPQFTELDEASQTKLIQEVIQEIALEEPQRLQPVMQIYASDDITPLAKDITKHAESFRSPPADEHIRKAFSVAEFGTVEDIAAATITSADIRFLKSLIPCLRALGSKSDHKLAQDFEALGTEPTKRELLLLESSLLTGGSAKTPFAVKKTVPTKAVKEDAQFEPFLPEFVEIAERVERARSKRIAFECAEQTIALTRFASVFLPRYQAAKSRAAALDFDDLIRKTNALLTSQSLSWVLFRLDARIDHVLVDEAQDTSPEQWDIIGALTGEMVAGESERSRTLFVVGDKKQSIYSFQGADASGFDLRAQEFDEQLKHGSGLTKGELLHSFRSSPAILQLVDSVFSETNGTGNRVKHRAFHDQMPGRVDLWPLVAPPEKSDEPPWHDPKDRTVANDAAYCLAQGIADHVQSLLESETVQGESGEWRPVRPADIMVLVQRRSLLFDKIISACKSRKIPIAGADILKVGSELAVRDILALLSFLALPEDDLSLASALKSPLLGFTEADLYDLAAKREKGAFLWQELRNRRTDYAHAFEVLEALRSKVDYMRPFELIHSILTEFDGRKKFLLRLGSEAEDGLDELLNQALVYEQSNVPTLTGFVASARMADIVVKRETETTGDLLRVMTVHGAKGLESPIVILPDTTFASPRQRQRIIQGPEGIPTLSRGRDNSTQQMQIERDRMQSSEAAERERLLYVAMTRAEKWLIVAGTQPTNDAKTQTSWHQQVANGLAKLDAEVIETPVGEGLRFSTGEWAPRPKSQASPPERSQSATDIQVLQPPQPPATTAPLAPSELGGAKVVASDGSESAGGTRRGRQMHLLLEHLTAHNDLLEQTQKLLSFGPDRAKPDEIEKLAKEAMQIIDRHQDIFSSSALAEVNIVGFSNTLGARISGSIDRLLVDANRVLAVDFKTNAIVPERPEETPEGILRQMGAYLEALEGIYPTRRIEVAILWTTTGVYMPLKHGIVRDSLLRATTS